MIQLIFLGTGQAIPTAKRNHTAVLLRYEDEMLLFDCGEGTQRQFRKAEINPCKLTRLCITHWHGDHVLGVPGLLQTLALNGYNKTLNVYGPKRTKQFMELMYKLFVFQGKIKINIEEKDAGGVFETEKFYIESQPLKHGTFCNAYAFVEKDKIRIKKDKLKRLKIKPADRKKLQQLAEGKNIEINSKIIKAKEMTYKQKGKKICIILDTTFTENAVKIAKNSDLLICEATYTEKDRAAEYKHLTAKQAAEIAKRAKVKKLILTHLSQRYDGKEKEILSEAKKIFKNTEIAEDLMKVEM